MDAEIDLNATSCSVLIAIIARQQAIIDGVRVSLDGKVSAVRAAQRLRVNGLERRIAQAERQVAKAEEQVRWQQVH